MTRELSEYKAYLPIYAERMLPKASKGFYVCPFCKSGEKRNKTGALKVYKEGYNCFACGEHGDIFELVGKLENLTFMESVNRVEQMFGSFAPVPLETKARKTNVRYKYKDYIEECKKNVNQAKEYLKKRGFTSKDAARFEIGYDVQTKGIVIPYGKSYSYYLWRSVEGKRFDKPKAEEAGPEPIYNVGALKSDKPCFICESPIDAMSIMIASEYSAIAVGGTGTKKLLDYIDRNGVKCPLIVSLDDDDDKERNAGLESAKVLMGELAGRKIPFVLAKYSKEQYPKTKHKDANDMLVSRREIFESDLKENARAAILKSTLVESGVLW